MLDVECGANLSFNAQLMVMYVLLVYIGWTSFSCGLAVYIETVKVSLIDFSTCILIFKL